MTLAAGATGASAAEYTISGGGALFPGGFGVHGGVWIRPFVVSNLSARFGGEYWRSGEWRYIGADASGLYRLEVSRYAADLSTRLSSLRPYAGAGISIGRWASSTSSWTGGDLYAVGGAQYELGSNLWAWAEVRWHAWRFGNWESVGAGVVSTHAGMGFQL